MKRIKNKPVEDEVEIEIEDVPVASVSVSKKSLPDGGTISVACKLPCGIVLRVFQMVAQNEAINNGVGYRSINVARQIPGEFTIFGVAHAVDKAPKCRIVAGYALTPNVPAELFNAWLAQNKDSDVVRNNLIFAYESIDMAAGAAQERATLRSGLEPLMLEGKDPRAPKGIRKDDGTDGARKAA